MLAEALEATSFLIQGGLLIPAVHPASGVFGGYFVTEGISPPPSGSQLPPDFPLVSRLVGKARPGQGPNLLTWQARGRAARRRAVWAGGQAVGRRSAPARLNAGGTATGGRRQHGVHETGGGIACAASRANYPNLPLPPTTAPAACPQGFYSNTSSLLQGVVQAAGDGQLVMDLLSTGAAPACCAGGVRLPVCRMDGTCCMPCCMRRWDLQQRWRQQLRRDQLPPCLAAA